MKLIPFEELYKEYKKEIEEILNPFRLSFTSLLQLENEERIFCFKIDEGFFILRLSLFHNNEPYLEILCAYGVGGGLSEKYIPFIIQLAKDLNIKYLEFSTKHDKIGDRLSELGFKRKEVIYELGIE